MLISAKAETFFRDPTSILVTTYAVPPRGRRPYTGAHFLFAPPILSLQFFLNILSFELHHWNLLVSFTCCPELLFNRPSEIQPAETGNTEIMASHFTRATERRNCGSNEPGR